MTQFKTKFLILFLLCSTTYSLFAQNKIAIGEWRAHLPYREFVSLTQSENTLFAATEWSIMLLDKEEMSTSFLSTVDGLSNSGMGVIKYSERHKTLIASYSNSTFDLITDSRIRTFNDIQTDGNFTDRTISDIYIDGDFAYFSCAFGVVRFNLAAEEFDFTLDLGIKVKATVVFDNQIYAATEEGIFTASNSPNLNLQDFSNWTLLDVDAGFPGTYSSSAIAVFDNQLYFDIDNALYRMNDGVLEEIYPAQDGLVVQYITTEYYGLLLGLRDNNDPEGQTIYLNTDGEIKEMGGRCMSYPLYAIEDQTGKIWFADTWRGLRLAYSAGDNCERMEFNSPLSQRTSEILIKDNQTYVAAGGVTNNGNFAGISDGTFILEDDGNWDIINRWEVPLLEQEDAILDHYKLAIHPTTGALYIGTFWGGLIERNNEEEYKVYNETNSSLQGATGDELRERVSGLAFDTENNLWIANNTAPKPISVLKTDGTWQNFDVPSNKGLRNMVVDQVGYKWATIDGTGQGVLVFDDGGTIDVLGDDRYRVISSSNTELPDNNVLSIAVDLEGAVWLGTANGVGVVSCGSIAIENECPVNRIIFEENIIDDENEYLLKGESVNTIAVDGANRKWIGTTNGVFVISEDGKEQIAFFDTNNSPLFDNNIIDIAINDEDGEVFIGTNKGLISYRSNATKGGTINESTAYAFPNPVRPEYLGEIAVRGLAQDANVKITDVNGQLVYETQAFGGQAIWDGNDYTGRRAATGVYLVFSTSDSLETPNTLVTKIMFVN